MKCNQCEGSYRKKDGRLELSDRFIGYYSVDNVVYYKCGRCGDILFPPKTLEKLEKTREGIREDLIKKYPIKDFLAASETASMLNISRQALHKHRRIRKGFIYRTELCGKIVYLKKSVLLFRETGDGRFLLSQSEEKVRSQAGYATPISIPKVEIFDPITGPENIPEPWKIINTRSEYKYAH